MLSRLPGRMRCFAAWILGSVLIVPPAATQGQSSTAADRVRATERSVVRIFVEVAGGWASGGPAEDL